MAKPISLSCTCRNCDYKFVVNIKYKKYTLHEHVGLIPLADNPHMGRIVDDSKGLTVTCPQCNSMNVFVLPPYAIIWN